MLARQSNKISEWKKYESQYFIKFALSNYLLIKLNRLYIKGIIHDFILCKLCTADIICIDIFPFFHEHRVAHIYFHRARLVKLMHPYLMPCLCFSEHVLSPRESSLPPYHTNHVLAIPFSQALKTLPCGCHSMALRNAWISFKEHVKEELDGRGDSKAGNEIVYVWAGIRPVVVCANGASLANVDIWQINSECALSPLSMNDEL